VYRRRNALRASAAAAPFGTNNTIGLDVAPASAPQYGAVGQGAILYNSHVIESVAGRL